jgi:hypothetical protein
LCGAETWTLRIVYQEYVDGFEMWFWRRMKKISWTGHVRNEVLLRVKEHKKEGIKKKANWIDHIFRRNWLLKHVTEGKIEGKIEGTERQGRRRKQLLVDLKEKRRKYYITLCGVVALEEAMDLL